MTLPQRHKNMLRSLTRKELKQRIDSLTKYSEKEYSDFYDVIRGSDKIIEMSMKSYKDKLDKAESEHSKARKEYNEALENNRIRNMLKRLHEWDVLVLNKIKEDIEICKTLIRINRMKTEL